MAADVHHQLPVVLLFPVQPEVEESWFNLNGQELQPLYYREELEGGGWMRTRGCPKDAWNGGCSLLVEGLLPSSLSKVSAR